MISFLVELEQKNTKNFAHYRYQSKVSVYPLVLDIVTLLRFNFRGFILF